MAVVIPLVTEFDSKGIRLAEKRFADFQKQAGQVGQSIKAAFMPAAAAVAGLGVAAFGAAKAAIDDQKSQAVLAAQLQATTKATQAQVQATEDYITALALATGVADDELRPALGRIARSTRDLDKAQKLLTLSVDVARGSGKSLAQVTEAIARAYGGNVKALARLDPSLRKLIDKTTTADEAVAMLAKNFEGNASRYADTFAGRIERLQVAVGEAVESFGYALLPILERFVNFITSRVLPYVNKLVTALEEQGLSGAVKMAARDIADFVKNADGWTGTIIDFTAAIVLLTGALKGLLLVKSIVGAFTALSGVLTAIGSAVLPGIAVSAGLVAGVFASILATVTAFVGLMRDDYGRSKFFESIINAARLVANGFIAAYNAAVALVNLPLAGANLLPGVNVGSIKQMPYLSLLDQDADFRRENRYTTDSAQIQINVNGAIDPISTGRQIADILDRTDRRGLSGFGR